MRIRVSVILSTIEIESPRKNFLRYVLCKISLTCGLLMTHLKSLKASDSFRAKERTEKRETHQTSRGRFAPYLASFLSASMAIDHLHGHLELSFGEQDSQMATTSGQEGWSYLAAGYGIKSEVSTSASMTFK